MHSSLLAVLATALLLPAVPATTITAAAPLTQDPAAEAPDLTTLYQGFCADEDFDGLVALWQKNKTRVLGTIDRDLEGSLALWESVQGGSTEEVPLPDDAKAAIDALHARALFGARAASAAFDRPIFLDYASSFVGWSTKQKRAFREGQAAFGRAVGGLRTDDHAAALEGGQQCFDLALPLGDWWGTAMGLGAKGRALLAMDRKEEALAALSQARLLNHELGLEQAEARNLTDMLDVLEDLEYWPRALAVCNDLMAMLGDAGSDMFGDRKKAIEAHL